MIEGSPPRLFGLPPGADFPRELIAGLEQRLSGSRPEAWAEIEIYVNTRRMQRRLLTLFDQGPPRLLPKIRLVTEIGSLGEIPDLPPPVPALRRRLELGQLVAGLLERQPDLAPRAALFDLSDSLAALLDEMQGEGVSPAALRSLDVAHLSGHWARTKAFLEIAERFDDDGALDAEARRRRAVERLAERWRDAPPLHPVIVAGSTGSRGATALFLQAVARLPRGAVVLPGYDFDQPDAIWAAMDDALAAEDHPQYRFRSLLRALDLAPDAVRCWHPDCGVPSPARNRLISLALRPAPVTDQWLDDGPGLVGIDDATAAMTLIEASSPRIEADAIALRLRRAAEEGQTAALISPDRTLTRQVTAALDRWGIEPDDSAGLPLPLSAPGRFLRHVAAAFGRRLTAEALLALLKHPLAASSGHARGPHLRWTRELELHIRRRGAPFPGPADLAHWAREAEVEDGRADWTDWLGPLLDGLASAGAQPLEAHVARHLRLAEALAAGPGIGGSGALWCQPAGEAAQRAFAELQAEAPHGGILTPQDYEGLFHAVLNGHTVHDPSRPHPGIMIWGTLEARVQGADLVILGGLNEGSWPETPPPDPWMNREMRAKAGLLLPERRIGLAAHDFQQAIAAKEVLLTRAVRDAATETVPSRWLNRLTNLLKGLGPQGGEAALKAMCARGSDLLAMAEALQAPQERMPPAPRPSPRPPLPLRPRKLAVTRIQTLIRDPYAIYATYVLNLRRLDPLRPEPDAPLRGVILHKVMERFVRGGPVTDPDRARARLLATADEVLAAEAPWPAARRIWRARLARVADWLIAGEIDRQAEAGWEALEVKGRVTLENGFTLTAEADRIDRIDRRHDGRLIIYDYKTGKPPTPKQMRDYDKQLALEAAMAERGGFEGVDAAAVDHVAHIGLGAEPKVVVHTLENGLIARTWQDLHALIDRYGRRQTGYTARRAVFSRDDVTDFDHLSRYGEWDESTEATGIEVGG